MATKTFEELKQLAIQIRDEKTNKQNTATRIGTQMLEHLDKLEQDYYDKTTTDEELKKRDEKLTELEKSSKITIQDTIEIDLTSEKAIINNSGAVQSWGDANLTDYIPIESGERYIFEIFSTTNSQRICTYKDDKTTIVRKLTPEQLNISNQAASKFYIEAEQNEAYIRYASKTGTKIYKYLLYGEKSLDDENIDDFNYFKANNTLTNLFNINGKFESIIGGYYTQKIRIIPDVSYIQYNAISGKAVQGFSTLDVNGNAVRTFPNGTNGFTAQENEVSAIFRVQESKLNEYVVTFGSVPIGELGFHKYILKYENLSFKNYLYGKSFYLISDSIGYGTGNTVEVGKSWYDYLLKKIGASNNSSKDAIPSQCLRTMADRLTSETLQNVNKIIVSGGTNSMNVFLLGTIEDKPTPDNWVGGKTYEVGERCLAGPKEVHGAGIDVYTYIYECTIGGTSSSDSNPTTFTTNVNDTFTDGTITWKCIGIATFYGDLWRVVKKIYECRKDIDIIFVIPPKTTNWKTWGTYTSKLKPKFEAIKEFCETVGFRYIDFNSKFPISEYSNETLMADTLHPTYNGYILMSDIAIGCM